MTRKRKVDNTQSEHHEDGDKKNRMDSYGYQSHQNEGPSQDGQFRRSFPQKPRGGPFAGRGGHRFSNGDGNFNGDRGGRYGGGRDDREPNFNDGEKGGTDGKAEYPTELVAYLRNIRQLKETEERVDEMVYDKCAEECAGVEDKLLSFRESCIVVEEVFGSTPHSAELFLSGLARIKHKRLLDLLFSGQSAHTIETLIYALYPIKTHKPIELIEKFNDLLCDNWTDATTCQNSAFLIRCLARVTCGLKRKEKNAQGDPVQLVQGQSAEIKAELSRIFDRIASLALEDAANPRVENVHVSLVVQDVLEADITAKMGKSSALVDKILSSVTENGLRQLWLGKNSSRVWEKLVMSCREETLQSLWDKVIVGHVSELAMHACANFPLQKFIGSVKSLELATDVCDETTPLIEKLLSADRWGVVEALLRCAARHEELQEPLLKQLRKFFKASKVDNKLNFLLNTLTLNKYNGKTFYVSDCHLHGSLLVEVLLSFNKVKTLSACLEALQADEVMQLAKNRCGSHVLQATFSSKNIGDEVKEKLIKAFENDWESLISDVYGSHVFETIWDRYDVRRRQDLMKKLVPIRSDSKFWKFAMLRCDMYLFRKDRKAWVEKMKKSVKAVKH
ncbi:hypothetical protein Q1695_005507 [Nippostrongylus brasiliensis]|nr:hypothetical protein Q1695_005507 [Nippostrongylus brasiliensis]